MSDSGDTIIDPTDLLTRLERGECILVDVREADEYARERIAGARLVPLSRLDAHGLPELAPGQQLVLYCASGTRCREAAMKLRGAGAGEVLVLRGGLGAWKAAGLETEFNRSAPISVMRQVQITAGSMVLLGAVLGAMVSPWFYGLSAFVGAGLVFAGATGTCAMAKLLESMPWNRRHDSADHGHGVGATAS
jgi:rhodanese-related sulfurtransferase